MNRFRVLPPIFTRPTLVTDRRRLVGIAGKLGLLAALGLGTVPTEAATCRRRRRPCKTGKQCCSKSCKRGRCQTCGKGATYVGPGGKQSTGGWCVSRFDKKPDAGTNSPTGVVTDADGNVYVADPGNHRVLKLNPAGKVILELGGQGTTPGKFDAPRDVAVDSAGNIYVADTGNDRIQKFNPLGIFMVQWGGAGSGNGKFSVPSGIAVMGSNLVFVADRNNHRIQRFSAAGAWDTTWGGQGTGDGEFNFPEGLALDTSGQVIVADTQNHRLQTFTAGGAFVSKTGSLGGNPGSFSFPCALSFSLNGHGLAVAESGNDRLQVIRANETPEIILLPAAKLGPFSAPRGVTWAPDGRLYAADSGNNRLLRLSAAS